MIVKCLLLLSPLLSVGAWSSSPDSGPSAGQGEQYELVLLTVGSETNPFWQAVGDAAGAAAASLDVNLSSLYLADEEALNSALDELLGEGALPDGIIFTGSAELSMQQLLPRAESAGVPTVLINVGLPDQKLDDAAGRFSHWLGQITPPDVEVGYQVASLLAQGVRESAAESKESVKILALTGGETDKAAVDRNEGLQRAAQQDPKIELLSLIETDWSPDDAARKLSAALDEHPEANAVWTVSGLMIPGILPAMAEAGRPAGDGMQVTTPVGPRPACRR